MNQIMHPSWNPIIHNLYEGQLLHLKDSILPNISFLPHREDIFNSFQRNMNDIKVVILGQDPYPTPNTAIGYAFAVNEDRTIPPSLRIIRQELVAEGIESYSGKEDFQGREWKTLRHWVEQDVLLLNTALTVETGKAGSHLAYWEEFTRRTIRFISATNPCIWLLWGKKAEAFESAITNPFQVKGYNVDTIKEIPTNKGNYVLKAPHPAASLYGGNTQFVGCNHFLFANEILKVNKKKQIKW